MKDTLHLKADDPILRISQVENSVELKKSTIYALIKEKKFPTPIRLGHRASGWLLSEISSWKQQRIAESRGHSTEGAAA